MQIQLNAGKYDIPYMESMNTRRAKTGKFSLEQARKQDEKARAKEQDKESGVENEIIVRPDGSKVLMTTTRLGGKEISVTCMEISKPNRFPEDAAAKGKDSPDAPECGIMSVSEESVLACLTSGE